MSAAAVFAVGVLTPGSAPAGILGPPNEVACTFDPDGHVLRIDYGVPADGPGQAPIVWITQVGDAIRIEEGFPGPFPNIRCAGGTPTVRNTDQIELAALTKLRTSETYISGGDGGLTPGATAEPGGDEIEIHSDLGRSAQLHVNGTQGADHWAFGSRGETHFVNLNAREGHPDGDLIVTPTPRSLSGNVGAGADRATAMGGAGTGAPLQTDLLLIGDRGSQRFVGGPGDDELLGYWGDDVLDGGAGDDRLDIVGGKGHDTLICGPGRDEFRSSNKDKVQC
jgi:hypothetical protein